MRSLLWLALALAAPAANAADPKTSLEKLPANTEYFASVLRLGETVEILGKTQLWKMVWNDKFVQEAWKKFLADYEMNEKSAPLRGVLNDPANKDWPALAGDAFSNEIFVAVGDGGGETLAMFGEFYGNSFTQGITEGIKNANNPEAAQKAQARRVLTMFNEKPERLKLPDILIGLKVSEPDKVAAQIKRLDGILPMLTKGTPVEGRIETAKIGGDEFRILAVDGSLLPWKEFEDRLDNLEDKPNEFKKLIDHVKKMKLTVAIGVRQGYLLIAIGHTTEQLAKFGGTGEKLASRAEFKPLAKFAGKPLTSVSYTSAKLRKAVAPKPEDIAGYLSLAKEGLKRAEQLPEEQRKAIEKDLEALAKDLATGFTTPGGAMDFSVRTPTGWESFAHDYTEPIGKSVPLTMLNQLGGNPLVAAVYRSGTTVEDYLAFTKWLKIFAGHGEKAVEALAPNGEEMVKKYREEAVPLLKELDQIVEKLWLPALADGQQGIVLDGVWTSKQWHAAMPPADKPMPMIELAFLLGVSDAAKFEKAVESLRLWTNKAYARTRELNPAGAAPEFEIPKPNVLKVKGVTLANYAIPEALGLDTQFLPTAGLTDKFAALSLSRGHTERLLKETPLKVKAAPLADPSKPLDGAFHVNWAGIVDTLAPWIEMGASFAPQPDDGPNLEEYLPKMLGVMKVFRSYTRVTYREAGGTVTHSEAIFGDVPAMKK